MLDNMKKYIFEFVEFSIQSMCNINYYFTQKTEKYQLRKQIIIKKVILIIFIYKVMIRNKNVNTNIKYMKT
jgi:hypothetical protein